MEDLLSTNDEELGICFSFLAAVGGGFLVVGLWFLGLAPKRIGGVELHFHEPLMER